MERDQSRQSSLLHTLFLVQTSLWTLLVVLAHLTAGSAVGYTPADYSVTTAGDAFSYTESFIEGDDTPSATSVTTSSGTVDSLPMLGQTTTTSGGVAGDLAGTIDSGGAISITAGSAGTTAIGQVIQELSIK